MEQLRDKLKKLDRFKYPLLVVLIGMTILLLPTGAKEESAAEEQTVVTLQSALEHIEGVGEVQVIISDKGAVVVCAGAENAEIRLDIIKAVCTYTGFGSDKVTVLKMSKQFMGG